MRSPLIFAVPVAMLLSVACQTVGLPPVDRGHCTLGLALATPRVVPLTAPYRVEMRMVESEGRPGVWVALSGTGWAEVDLTTIAPNGKTDGLSEIPGPGLAQALDNLTASLDAPGTWRLRLADRRNACVREVVVEVTP